MSNITSNQLVKGARGKLGDQFVYRTRGKKTFITVLPTINPNIKSSARQQAGREHFGEAAVYAKGAIANPELKAAYGKKLSSGVTAFNIALRDYLIAPKVKRINASHYTGRTGSQIIIKAKDDFRVTSVHVSIHSATGDLIEEGAATINPLNPKKWIYTTSRENPVPSGCTIRATARDIPENTGSLDLVLP